MEIIMKKNIIAALLFISLCICLPLGGCTVKNLNVAHTASSQTTSLPIYCFDPGVKSRLSVATDAYIKSHPDVKISLSAPSDPDKALDGLQKKLSQNEEPVLFNIRGTSDMMEIKDSLYELSNTPVSKLVKYDLLDNVTYNNHIYGLPLGIEGYGILYNKEILKAAKIDAEKITDAASLSSAVKKLDRLIKSGKLKKKFPRLNRVFCPISEENVKNLIPFIVGGNGSYKNEKSLNSSETLLITTAEHVKKLIGLNQKHSENKLNEEYKSDAYRMANEHAAMLIAGSRIINDIKEEKTQAAEKLAFLTAPCEKLTVGAPAYWSVNKNAEPEQITAALDFINWLYSSEKGKSLVIDSLYLVPAYSGSERIVQTEPLNASITELINKGRTVPYICPGLPREMNERYFSKKLLYYTSDKKTFKKVISEIQKDFKRLQKG